jgi:hypothetical protein
MLTHFVQYCYVNCRLSEATRRSAAQMSDQIRAGIEGMTLAIAAKLAEIEALKVSVNVMCRQVGEEPMYPDADSGTSVSGAPIRADQFYGKGLQTAVREYLDRIKRAAGTDEIIKVLERGGFDFNEQGWAKGHRPRILAIALVKSSAMFRRLPNGMFGLESWYEPRARKGKGQPGSPSTKVKPHSTGTPKRDQKKSVAARPNADGDGHKSGRKDRQSLENKKVSEPAA